MRQPSNGRSPLMRINPNDRDTHGNSLKTFTTFTLLAVLAPGASRATNGEHPDDRHDVMLVDPPHAVMMKIPLPPVSH